MFAFVFKKLEIISYPIIVQMAYFTWWRKLAGEEQLKLELPFLTHLLQSNCKFYRQSPNLPLPHLI